jgi:hypothetical protein
MSMRIDAVITSKLKVNHQLAFMGKDVFLAFSMTYGKGACGCPDGCLRDLLVSMISVRLDDASHLPYTAISHVWSDGIGNTEANALPYCLLERHFETTRSWRYDKQPESQGEPMVVCIDTLCCPFDQGEGKQLALYQG